MLRYLIAVMAVVCSDEIIVINQIYDFLNFSLM